MITSYAALPTAHIDQLVNKNTVVLPKSPAKNISGTIIFIVSNFTSEIKLISSINAENNKKQAMLAVPTEYPLVLALVTFPTASNLSVMSLTLSF